MISDKSEAKSEDIKPVISDKSEAKSQDIKSVRSETNTEDIKQW